MLVLFETAAGYAIFKVSRCYLILRSIGEKTKFGRFLFAGVSTLAAQLLSFLPCTQQLFEIKLLDVKC